MSEREVTLPDHFSATVSLTISEPQPQYGIVQLNAECGASRELISCDVNRADFLAAVSEVLNVDITPRKPTEPAGLGAVVEDASGKRFVRYDGDWPWLDGTANLQWQHINAVRVLSEGVPA